jgi:hypothetical protein
MCPAPNLRELLGELGRVAGARARYVRHRSRYGEAAPRPYELLWVDPAAIEYCTLPSLMAQRDLSRHGSHVVGGGWDRRPTHDGVWYTRAFDPPVRAAFDDHALYRSMAAHFEEGVPWPETDWYRWVEDNPGRLGQYPDVETMERRLADLEALYEAVETDGYRSQRRLAASEDPPLGLKSFPCPEHYEVDVNIGRDGDLLFNFNGRHRLAVAKLLDVERIPVRVFARHERWQRHRTELLGATDPSVERPTHPDVRRLLPAVAARD